MTTHNPNSIEGITNKAYEFITKQLQDKACEFINNYANKYNYTEDLRKAHLAPIRRSVLMELKCQVKTKLGVAGTLGEFVLVDPISCHNGKATFWSNKNNCWTTVKREKLYG